MKNLFILLIGVAVGGIIVSMLMNNNKGSVEKKSTTSTSVTKEFTTPAKKGLPEPSNIQYVFERTGVKRPKDTKIFSVHETKGGDQHYLSFPIEEKEFIDILPANVFELEGWTKQVTFNTPDIKDESKKNLWTPNDTADGLFGRMSEGEDFKFHILFDSAKKRCFIYVHASSGV